MARIIDPITGGVVEEQRQEFVSMEGKISLSESLGFSYDLAQRDTAVPLIKDWLKLNEIKNKTQDEAIDKNVLTEVFNTEKPFDEDMSYEAAAMIADRYAEKVALMQKIERGPDGVIAVGAQFGANVLAHMTDPLELGLTLAAGAGAGALLRSGGLGLQGVRLGNFMARNPFMGEVMADFAGNMAIEPILAAGKMNMMEEYTAVDFATSAVAAPLAIAGLKYGATKGMRYLWRAGTGTMGNVIPSSVGANLAGRNVDLAGISKAMDNEINFVRPREGHLLDTPSKAYIVSKDGNIDTNNSFKLSDFDENGIHATSNVQRADAAAGSSLGDGQGYVHQVETQGLKTLDTSVKVKDSDVGDVLEVAFGKVDGNKTIAEALEDIQLKDGDAAIADTKLIKGAFEELGYDAVSFKDADQNRLSFLDTERAKAAIESADSGTRVETPQEARQAMEQLIKQQAEATMDPKNQIGRSADADKAIAETPKNLVDEVKTDLTPDEADKVLTGKIEESSARETSSVESLRQLAEDGRIKSEELDTFLETVNDMKLEAADEEAVLRASLACMGA